MMILLWTIWLCWADFQGGRRKCRSSCGRWAELRPDWADSRPATGRWAGPPPGRVSWGRPSWLWACRPWPSCGPWGPRRSRVERRGRPHSLPAPTRASGGPFSIGWSRASRCSGSGCCPSGSGATWSWPSTATGWCWTWTGPGRCRWGCAPWTGCCCCCCCCCCCSWLRRCAGPGRTGAGRWPCAKCFSSAFASGPTRRWRSPNRPNPPHNRRPSPNTCHMNDNCYSLVFLVYNPFFQFFSIFFFMNFYEFLWIFLFILWIFIHFYPFFLLIFINFMNFYEFFINFMNFYEFYEFL